MFSIVFEQPVKIVERPLVSQSEVEQRTQPRDKID